jgi:hypothetical protein
MRRIVSLSLVSLALVACTSTYHPEYHPVTVSNLSYPVMVNNGGSPTERSPTYVVPGVPMAALPGAIVPTPSEQPPPGFFNHE